jgi:creatinine amidohydrolase/Fe(II)-dependent formamide hydrolase-like protein
MDYHSFEKEHPQQLEGSAYYVEDDLFHRILEATLRNLARAGFKIVVAHGHGPSNKAFGESKAAFEKRFGLKLFGIGELGGKGNDGIMTDHAAYNETSLVMGLYPELADLEKLADESAMTGIWGDDPRSTSEEVGKRIIEHNLSLAGSRLLEELAQLEWKPRRMNYRNVARIYK